MSALRFSYFASLPLTISIIALCISCENYALSFLLLLLLFFLLIFFLLTAWSKYSSAKKQESYPRCKFKSNKRYNTKYVLIFPCISYFKVCRLDLMHASVSEKIFNRLSVKKENNYTELTLWCSPVAKKTHASWYTIVPTKCFDPF